MEGRGDNKFCGLTFTLWRKLHYSTGWALSLKRVCRNEANAMLVILNPSPVILNEVKNLCHWLRVNSVKNLIESTS